MPLYPYLIFRPENHEGIYKIWADNTLIIQSAAKKCCESFFFSKVPLYYKVPFRPTVHVLLVSI